MKKILYLILIFGISLNSFSQTDDYYFYKGKKVQIEINKELIYVECKDDVEVDDLLSKNQLSTKTLQVQKSKNKKVNLLSGVEKSQYEDLKSLLRNNDQIVKVSSFVGKHQPVSISGPFYVKLKSNDDYPLLEEFANENSCVILRQVKYMPEWYAMSVPKHSEVLNVANLCYETGYFEDVDPGFDINFKSSCITDGDFGEQWGLSNTNNIDIDINVCDAWNITKGCEGIVVAVVDGGIDMAHAEFEDNIYPNSFDALTGNTQAEVYDDHGTHVAGIIGANQNGLQVSGVAPLASLMSVSHSFDITDDSSEQLASGISWAWQNGADIINNSWGDAGGHLYNDLQSALLESAIDNALSNGRNGLGCVIVFAAGNWSPAIDYPANYTSDIICVGSIDNEGMKADDSGFGNELDLVAPGVDIWSTIRNNELSVESGTSMAAPHVAGVAALILSVNSDLTQEEVGDIIESNCTKLEDYEFENYSDRENGEWNTFVGYGLLNANDAVLAALPEISGSDSDFLCSSGSTFSIDAPSSCMEVSWSSSSNITFPYGNTGSSVVAKANSSSSSGSGWIEASIDNSITLPRKEFWVGVPKILGGELNNPDDPEYTEVEYICQTYDYSAKNEIKILTGGTDSDVNYEWYKETTNFSYLAEDDVISVKAYQTGSIVFKVRADNVCGWSSWRTFAYPVIDCDDNGGGEELFFSASPNPANEFIEISLQEEEVMESSMSLFGTSINSKQVESNEEYEIQIWHEQFGLVHRQKYSDKQIQIPTNELTNGIYFLHVIQNGEVYKQQIKVVH